MNIKELLQTFKWLETGVVTPVDDTDATQPITALSCKAGKYYRVDVAVGALAVTLPAMEENNVVKSIKIFLSTGANGAVTFASTAVSGGSAPAIYYQSGFNIAASKTYEVNCLWNGLCWVLSAMEVNNA